MEDVRAFEVYLGISRPALNQTVCALQFFYGVTLDRAEIPERIAYARRPRKLPAILSADACRAISRSGTVAKGAYGADERLCRRTAWLGDGETEGRRHRQPAHGDLGPSRQGRQGSHRDAVAAVAWYPVYLLAADAPEELAVSRTGRQADRCAGALGSLPFGDQGGRIDQAGQRAHAAAQLCYPSARGRRRYPHHPGTARAHPPVDDGALHAGWRQLRSRSF